MSALYGQRDPPARPSLHGEVEQIPVRTDRGNVRRHDYTPRLQRRASASCWAVPRALSNSTARWPRSPRTPLRGLAQLEGVTLVDLTPPPTRAALALCLSSQRGLAQ